MENSTLHSTNSTECTKKNPHFGGGSPPKCAKEAREGATHSTSVEFHLIYDRFGNKFHGKFYYLGGTVSHTIGVSATDGVTFSMNIYKIEFKSHKEILYIFY